MLPVHFTQAALANHGALIQRISSIISITLDGQNVFVRCAGEDSSPPPKCHCVELESGDADALVRIGGKQTLVRYSDPNSEVALATAMCALTGPNDPIAGDPDSLAVFALAQRLASKDIQVLINGPTGTGKEVLSRFIHSRSGRADKPFIAVNCAAMPETMLEAMLFGHQKGAFTGANAASEGFIRAADGGTLLLDEVSEMPLPLQAKLLRALQEQEVVPIGSTKPVKVDVRIIAAGNRDLPLEVAEGRFREDLYYRLNVFPLTLEPLADRSRDIALLAQAMILRHSPEIGEVPVLAADAIRELQGHDWPGNVRELENVLRRALILSNGSLTITAEHIMHHRAPSRVERSPEGQTTGQVIPFKQSSDRQLDLSSAKKEIEKQAIISALASNDGNRSQTARDLNMSERTLRYRLKDLRDSGVDVDIYSSGDAQCRQ